MIRKDVTVAGKGDSDPASALGMNAETRFVLSAEALRRFTAALNAPARRIPALRKLLKTPSVLEQ
jgi:uncharacterized protein (DUF1778 family)